MDESKGHTYLVFMLLLSLFALCLMALELTDWIAPESKEVVEYVDNVVCLLFFVDFGHQLVRSKHRARYLLTWGLLDLASCVPMVDALRWMRTARMVRIVRVLRCVRSARLLLSLVIGRRIHNVVLVGCLVVMVMVTTSSISVLHFEAGAGQARITTAGDAIWWTLYTMLTIGYDKAPVTAEGTGLGAVLGFLGMGIFGTISGCAASWFLGSREAESATTLEDVRQEVAALKRVIATRFPEPGAYTPASPGGGNGGAEDTGESSPSVSP